MLRLFWALCVLYPFLWGVKLNVFLNHITVKWSEPVYILHVCRFLTWDLLNTRGLDCLDAGGLWTVPTVECCRAVLSGKGNSISFPTYTTHNVTPYPFLNKNFAVFSINSTLHCFLQDHQSLFGWRAKDCEESFEDPEGKGKASF